MSVSRNKEVVARMWDALYRKDWEALRACLAPSCHYEDVPAPDPGATGPDNVVKRLRIGLDHVMRFDHEVHRTVAEGDSVLVEHTETWHFDTGEQVVNHFVTVHELEDGRITLWRDYWDLGILMRQAPKWWIEAIARVGADAFA
jgi:ketosteroid isomerase-like protein